MIDLFFAIACYLLGVAIGVLITSRHYKKRGKTE